MSIKSLEETYRCKSCGTKQKIIDSRRKITKYCNNCNKMKTHIK